MILQDNQSFENGKYRIESFIARGGMAEVWRAEETATGNVRALKILTRKSLAHDDIVERFKLEYDMLLRLTHPSIVSVYDFGWHSAHGVKLPWYTMDYFPLNLRQRLPQVSIGEGIRLLLPILDALGFAHSKQICHRDLKPINILVDAQGNTSLTDFGIAKEMDRNRNLTGRNIIGTATYISPEQCLGVPVVPASDIYSMGVILYQLCTGRYPFEDPSEINVIKKHINETPADIRTINQAISDELCDSVMRCLEKDLKDRYQGARELIADLRKCPEYQEAADRILTPGELIMGEAYRVITLIEQGGFAEVYRVKGVKSGHSFAMKILMPALTYDRETLKRFEREIKILKTLDHPNVIKVVADGSYEHKGISLPFFIMRFFPSTLQTSMSEPIDADRAIMIVVEVLEALEHSHSTGDGIFHRDIKPSNVLISGDGHGYLTDFGIAKVSEGLSSIVTRSATMTRAAIGTSAYMAPEQIKNDPVDARADIYSIGIILYELAASKRPFDAKSSEQITAMHLYVEPESPRLTNPNVLPRFDAVVMKCLEKEPDDRYADVPELIRALMDAQYRDSWFGEPPPEGFSFRGLKNSAIKSFSTPGPYLAAAAALVMFVIGMSAAVAWRGATIGLPEGGTFDSAYYPMKVVGGIAERMDSLEAAMLTRIEETNAPPASTPPLPPEFLDEERRVAFGAFASARARAAEAGDPALTRRLDSRMAGLFDAVGRPQISQLDYNSVVPIEPGTRTRYSASFRTDASESVASASKFTAQLMRGAPGGGAFTPAGQSVQVRPGRSEGEYTFELADLAGGQYKVLLAGSFTSSMAEAQYQFEQREIAFEIREVDRPPVHIAVVSSGRHWKLEASDTEFDSWQWRIELTHDASGARVGASQGEAIHASGFDGTDLDLDPDGDFYRGLAEGIYQVTCEAKYTVEEQVFDTASLPSEELRLVIDRTPPTLEAVGGPKSIVLWPGDKTRANLRVADAFAAGRDINLVLDGRVIAAGSGGAERSIDIQWRRHESSGVQVRELTILARDINGRGGARDSSPITVRVHDVGQDIVNLLEDWKSLQTRVRATPGRYARTNRLAPPPATPPNRAWVEATIDDPDQVTRFRALYAKRVALKAADDRMGDLADHYRRIISGAGPTFAAHKQSVLTGLNQALAEWVQSDADDLTPRRQLASVRDALLPSIPNVTSVIRQIDSHQDAALPRYRIESKFVAGFSPQARYRYVIATAEPPESAGDRIKLLQDRGNITIQRDKAPTGIDLTLPHYVTIQLLLEDEASGATFTSPPASFALKPLVTIDANLQRELGTLAKLIGDLRADTAGKYGRTIALLRASKQDFLDANLRTRDDWLLKNSQSADPQAIGSLRSVIGTIQQTQKTDLEFGKVKAEIIERETGDWQASHRDALGKRLVSEWSGQKAESVPGPFVEAQTRAYKLANRAEVLAPPSVDDSIVTQALPDLEKLVIPRAAIGGSLDQVNLAWASPGGAPQDSPDAWWKPQIAGEQIKLRPPGRRAAYDLFARTERPDQGLGKTLTSKAVRVAARIAMPVRTPRPTPVVTARPTDPPTPKPTPVSGVTLAQANALGREIVNALGQMKGSGRKAEDLLRAYTSLFEDGGSASSSSSLFAIFADRSNMVSEGNKGNFEYLDIRFSAPARSFPDSAGERTFYCELDWRSLTRRENIYTWTGHITLRASGGRIRIVRDQDFPKVN